MTFHATRHPRFMGNVLHWRRAYQWEWSPIGEALLHAREDNDG
jgi:hypothetical protein